MKIYFNYYFEICSLWSVASLYLYILHYVNIIVCTVCSRGFLSFHIMFLLGSKIAPVVHSGSSTFTSGEKWQRHRKLVLIHLEQQCNWQTRWSNRKPKKWLWFASDDSQWGHFKCMLSVFFLFIVIASVHLSQNVNCHSWRCVILVYTDCIFSHTKGKRSPSTECFFPS